MIFGIGIDVVENGRVADAIRRHGDRFIQKIYQPAEAEYCRGMKDPTPHFAVRFAAKSRRAGKTPGVRVGTHQPESFTRLRSGKCYRHKGEIGALTQVAATSKFNHSRVCVPLPWRMNTK
jgi:holo-[acyl-carrier-protein] synthase